jgi:limonene-1,2-epoxide hydrolase
MMADAKQVVLEFCKAWEALDQQRILDSFTDDGVYHNMPIAPAQGKDAIKALLAMILAPASAVTFEIKHIAVEGDAVLTERVDTFKIGDKTVKLDVMGTFEVRDGKIAAWRDFFDMASWTRQTTG